MRPTPSTRSTSRASSANDVRAVERIIRRAAARPGWPRTCLMLLHPASGRPPAVSGPPLSSSASRQSMAPSRTLVRIASSACSERSTRSVSALTSRSTVSNRHIRSMPAASHSTIDHAEPRQQGRREAAPRRRTRQTARRRCRRRRIAGPCDTTDSTRLSAAVSPTGLPARASMIPTRWPATVAASYDGSRGGPRLADFYQTGVVATLHRLGRPRSTSSSANSNGSPSRSLWRWCCRA